MCNAGQIPCMGGTAGRWLEKRMQIVRCGSNRATAHMIAHPPNPKHRCLVSLTVVSVLLHLLLDPKW